MSDHDIVTSFPNAALAELAAERLRAEGIDVRIAAAGPLGVAGGIDDASTKVLVPAADAARARAILGTSAPVTSAAPRSAANEGRRAGWSPLWMVSSLLLLVLSAFLAMKRGEALQQLDGALAGGDYGSPRRDGLCDVFPWKETDTPGYARCDLDDDGVQETIRTFDSRGRPITEAWDPNDSGRPTAQTSFDAYGVAMVRSVDADRDGIFEESILLDRRGLESGRFFDDDRDGRPERWIATTPDGGTEVWLDPDGDGLADEMERRSATGEVVQRLVESPEGWVAPASGIGR
jgi:hypothetical protein